MTCAVAGCLRRKAQSGPLCLMHWTRVSLELRLHFRNTVRLLDTAAASPGVNEEDRERFQALSRQVLKAVVAQSREAARGEAA